MPQFGSKSTALQVVSGIDLTEKTVLVTGASSGIGFETARVLAGAGASRVVCASSNYEKLRKQCDVIVKAKSKTCDVIAMELDLASFESIRAFTKEFQSRYKELHILVANAGIAHSTDRCGGLTEDGLGQIIGVNHFGHFLLISLLFETLCHTEPSRIVVVSSIAASIIGISEVQTYGNVIACVEGRHTRGSLGIWDWIAYGQSKLCNQLFTRELQRRIDAFGVRVTVNSVHPGQITTPVFEGLPRVIAWPHEAINGLFGKTVEQGAATQVYAAVSPELEGEGGLHLQDCRVVGAARLAHDQKLGRWLWKLSMDVTKADWGHDHHDAGLEHREYV